MTRWLTGATEKEQTLVDSATKGDHSNSREEDLETKFGPWMVITKNRCLPTKPYKASNDKTGAQPTKPVNQGYIFDVKVHANSNIIPVESEILTKAAKNPKSWFKILENTRREGNMEEDPCLSPNSTSEIIGEAESLRGADEEIRAKGGNIRVRKVITTEPQLAASNKAVLLNLRPIATQGPECIIKEQVAFNKGEAQPIRTLRDITVWTQSAHYTDSRKGRRANYKGGPSQKHTSYYPAHKAT